MIKKFLFIIFAALFLLTGCASGADKSGAVTEAPSPTPSLPPEITKPEGRILNTTPPSMQGVITKLSEDLITIRVEDTEHSLILSEEAKKTIEVFKEKQNVIIQPGSFVMVEYEKNDSLVIATKLSLVKSN